MNIYIETYGCTANHGDSLLIEHLLKKNGHKITNLEKSDFVIINTCTVINKTERRMLKKIKELKNLSKKLIVAGCLPAAQPDVLKEEKINCEIITPKTIENITDLIPRSPSLRYSQKCIPSPQNSARAKENIIGIVSISQGCVGSCSYCIVKKARGNLKSYNPDFIVKSVESLIAQGKKEIQITSQDTGGYGLDFIDKYRLPDLLNELADIKGDFRVRVGMMNPSTAISIVSDLVDAFDNPKIFKFLHLPIQSGSDKVLEDMNRKHSVSDYKEIVNAFKNKFSDITLSTDFIVGYPTETEEDFKKTIEVIKETKPTKVNITRFSPRPNTPAYKMKDILERTKKERSRILTNLCNEIALKEYKKYLNRTLEVMVTEKGKYGTVIARDCTYKNIVIKEDLPLGTWQRVQIKSNASLKPTYLLGVRE
ncbi:MAG: tRNA (N(6)-L-threonylcarbamoyladenosine(37)-C(2))-methylthiotransferase [Methanosarcinales archaeon]